MDKITAATLNIHGRYDRWLERRELIVSEIVDHSPDIISLQEIYRPIGQARWLRNQVNSRLTGRTQGPYKLVQRGRRHLLSGNFEATAILCKMRILSYDHLSVGGGGYLALRVNIELDSRDSLDFVAIRLDPLPINIESRLEQVLKLQGWLHGRDLAQLQIVAGDFGETPDGLAVQQMKQIYHSCFELARGFEPIATYPTALVNTTLENGLCLDYIFISSSVGSVLRADLFCRRSASHDSRLYPSDHVGLLAEIELPH